ncbi:cupredoxin domain-containing protein [Streptomyces winkii]|uniref:cupredoxin domain-containing protein n=1 Tax=Streptomyces winkii TaxID=3051178 RepID=UPI0028D25354|nr:cupredoxin family copper-binding protein [Streptomyces sp. DSM 40971]
MQDEDTGRRTAPAQRGSRGLLIGGLAAAISAVACVALLQSASGAPAADPAAPAAAHPAAAKAADHTIKIKDMAYAQPKLTVKVGETVTWVNEDSAPHTVTTTSGPEKLDSGNLEKGESWSYTFKKAGTYSYYCGVHPDMKAKITVENDSSGSSGGASSGGSGASGSTSGGSSAAGGTTGGSSTGGASGGHSGGMWGGSDSGGMPGGSAGGGGSEEQCHSVKESLMPVLQHLNSAHLERSPGEQVQDALKLDQYIKLHTVWVESILTPAVDGGGAVADGTLSALLQHVKSAHLEASPGQQVQDILNPDAYVKTHTVWAEKMLAPTEKYLTTSC